MNEILQENKRLQAQVEKLLTENMELTAVIRALRKNAREDAATIETAKRELWLWKYEKSTEAAND